MHEVENSPWVVLKFGGTSVSSLESWERIANRVRACMDEGLRPVVVQSAMSGVTNTMEVLLEQALTEDAAPVLEELGARHQELADTMGVALPEAFHEQLAEVGRLLAGVRLVGEVSPRVAARVLGAGELLTSLVGAEYLNRVGFGCEWVDAREILVSRADRYSDAQGRYLAASCDYQPDTELSQRLLSSGAVILTQGFIAANRKGETVVLGRGGSDTSAAYLAARLLARRLEIWSDVPGMFTADPHAVPSARLLYKLEYTEAQEIATMGGKVLHPHCIAPVRAHAIPLHLGCTARPDIRGTEISAAGADTTPRVKAVSSKKGVTLVSMQTRRMWHQVGFLADAFARFTENGLSVDLVSTSETNVTVTLDVGKGRLHEESLAQLVEDLEEICTVTLIRDCAAVSLIGRKIRAILHKLGPVLELFEEHKVHLLSQAASDLNFTVVIDGSQADRLVQKLHRLIVESDQDDALLGPPWHQLFDARKEVRKKTEAWWRVRSDELLAVAPADQAAYVYDLAQVSASVAGLRALDSIGRLLYAVKANWNPSVLRRVLDAGLSFECVSVGEINHVLGLFPELDRDRILFTPNFAPAAEYRFALDNGIRLTLDSLYPLEHWPDLFEGREVFVRLDLGRGQGHHQFVRTAGEHSKFGVPLFEMERLEALAQAGRVRIVGLHTHAGSGVFDSGHWPETAVEMAKVAERFPDVRVLDLGGGLGVPDRSSGSALDLAAMEAGLQRVRQRWPRYELWLEPGRYIVAAAGVLLARVTQTKGKGRTRFVGISTGMNTLIRPMLYGAYHEIVNLSRLDETRREPATIVGPICESGDLLGADRLMPYCEEGDVILIANVGAYGRVMSSRYNLREPATELVLQ